VDRSSQGIFVRSSLKEDGELCWEDQIREGQIFGLVKESNFMWFHFDTFRLLAA
jgi:hypothetical protein